MLKHTKQVYSLSLSREMATKCASEAFDIGISFKPRPITHNIRFLISEFLPLNKRVSPMLLHAMYNLHQYQFD
jgi:hypothetical protein